MTAFLFRCPNTALEVQGWLASDVSDRENETYETVRCTACRQLHLVNPATGKVLGAAEEQ